MLQEWAELADQCPEKEWHPLVEQALEDELRATAHLPFATAIRHTLVASAVCQ